MKIKSMPKEVLSEILLYLADYERMGGLEQTLQGSVAMLDVRTAFREIAVQLREEIVQEQQSMGVVDSSKIGHLSQETRKILSSLSPREEKILLRVFGLLEEN